MLPPNDETFLQSRGYVWELVPDGGNGWLLIVHDLEVGAGGFMPAQTDLMIRIPPQYPLAALDMWYCDPPVRLAATGQYPNAADQFESYGGRNWQRFSRHLPNGAWRPGTDGLRSFFHHVDHELQGKGAATCELP